MTLQSNPEAAAGISYPDITSKQTLAVDPDRASIKPTAPQDQAEDSLKKRYFYKLGTSVVGLLIGLITQVIVPRALGPAAYGAFSFLSNFFTQIINFFDAGTSTGFYSKLSQRLREPKLIRFYWGFTSIVSVGVFLFVSGVFALGVESWLWPEQMARFIWLAMVWGLLTWYTQIVNRIVDAYGLTVGSEIARTQQKILGASLILLMFWLKSLNLATLFLYHYLILLFLFLSWWRVLKQNGLTILPNTRLSRLDVTSYSREFYDYSAPLVSYAFIGLLTGVLDRWLLQKFAGSVEQGFYGLSYRIGTICFLFTNAMTPLLIREFSRAHGNRDLAKMRILFRRYIPILYSIAAFLGTFVAVQASKVGVIFGGDRFQGATLPIAIMAFYPLHQTYNQLSGSVFLATGRTRLYRNLGVGKMLLGLPLIFWMIAPEELWGLNLGATGLALKTVALQFIAVNLQLWFNARLLSLSFWNFLGRQIFSVALLAGMAWPVIFVIDQFIQNTLFAFFVSGVFYTLGSVLLLLLFPSAFSFVSRSEIINQLTALLQRVKETIS